MNIDQMKQRPEEETRHELEDARKAFSEAQDRLEHAKRRAEIREELKVLIDVIASSVRKADELEAELLATDHLFAVHEIEFLPAPPIHTWVKDQEDLAIKTASEVFGYPDTTLTVADDDTVGQPTYPTVFELEAVEQHQPQRTETPLVATEAIMDDPEPAKVSRTGYKHIPGKHGQPPRELPPAPKANVVNYCKSKKYPIHVTLEGDLAALDISWTEDDGLSLDKDGYTDPDEAYEDAKDTAMAAAGVGAEGQIKVWADVGNNQPAMILWHYNGAN